VCVLIEGLSVVVTREALERFYPGGVRQYRLDCPNQTYCADIDLTRVGFMVPDDVGHWINLLEQHGLVFVREGRSTDMAVVDQVRGPTAPCDWLDFGRQPEGYLVAWLHDTEPDIVEVPLGWSFERSLSKSFTFTPIENVDRGLQYEGHEGKLDVYTGADGERLFLGRVFPPRERQPSE
jgi:hypothetical protein